MVKSTCCAANDYPPLADVFYHQIPIDSACVCVYACVRKIVFIRQYLRGLYFSLERMLPCCFFLEQIKHMMAFIEQEAKEKVEEIDAKVTVTSLGIYCIFVEWTLSCFLVFFPGRGRV